MKVELVENDELLVIMSGKSIDSFLICKAYLLNL